MIRITNSSLKRHKKIRLASRGFVGSRSRLFKVAKESVRNANFQRTESRKKLKRTMRSAIWIPRINSFAREHFNMSYSKFMNLVTIKDRKILTKLITTNPTQVKLLMP